jgi:hypothetical protein
MAVDPKSAHEEIIKILSALTEHERALLNGVLRIERAHIHIPKQPHVKGDLLTVVKESIK